MDYATTVLNYYNFYLIKKFKESVIMENTMNFGNVNVEDLNSNESLRNSVIDNFTASDREFMEYFDEIMEEAGLKFEFIPDINLTTIRNASETIGHAYESLKNHIKRHPEFLDELELHGAKKLKSVEIQELLGKTTSGSQRTGRFSLVKTQSGASIILRNGTEFKLANGQTWYLTPEAVLDFCMIMTGDKAIAIRSAIINKLKEGQKSQNIVNKVRHSLSNTILDLSIAFDKYTLNNLVKTSFDTTSYRDKLKAKKLLINIVDQLTDRFNKAQVDYANGNIDKDEYECVITRVSVRKQACLELIVKISEELEDDRRNTEETLSESAFTSGNIAISTTDALKMWYNNYVNDTNVMNNKFNANGLYKKLHDLGILSSIDGKGNRKLQPKYKFIRNSFILPETLMSFSCRVNKYGYAFLDVILSIYYGKLIIKNDIYDKNTYSIELAEEFIKSLSSKTDVELKEEISALIITRVKNNCYTNL